MSKSILHRCIGCNQDLIFRADQKYHSKECARTGSPVVKTVAHPEEIVKKLLLKGEHALSEIAETIRVSAAEAEKIIDSLRASGHNVSHADGRIRIEKALPQGGQLVVDAKDFFDGEWHKFGALGDTHLYSKHARLDVLNCLYDIYEKEGIKHVYHTGNAIDGECRFNKFDLVGRSGMGPQLEYFAKNYPKRDGITTHFITGDDHEGWYIQREGVNIGWMMEKYAEDEGRTDLKWIGHVEADVKIKTAKGEAWMRVMHPGGGSSYATSYTEQKIVESFQGGEKPQILLLGHYHKFNQGYSREVHTVQCGCTQDQTTFMRKLKLSAHVGGTIIRFHLAPTGEPNRFNVEWIPYYDRRFYESKDKYRRW